MGGIIGADFPDAVRDHRDRDRGIEDILAREVVFAQEPQNHFADLVAGMNLEDSRVAEVLDQLGGGTLWTERPSDSPGNRHNGVELEEDLRSNTGNVRATAAAVAEGP